MKSPLTGNKINPPKMELFKSIPEIFGIRSHEEPHYRVIAVEGDIEVRRYPAATIASITLQGTFDEYREEAFEHLAAYIFGENTSPEGSEKIAMTVPVIQKQNQDNWTMSFILPEKYNFERPPEALDPAIRLSRLEPRLIAAVEYSGSNDMDRMNEHKNILERWLAKHPEYKANGAVYWAQYDAPFVIPFLKRNEAMLEISV